MPKAILRYAGGRETRLSKEIQKLGLRAGINGMLVGNYLTTDGVEISQDKELIKEYQKQQS
jgi:biotin synthase